MNIYDHTRIESAEFINKDANKMALRLAAATVLYMVTPYYDLQHIPTLSNVAVLTGVLCTGFIYEIGQIQKRFANRLRKQPDEQISGLEAQVA